MNACPHCHGNGQYAVLACPGASLHNVTCSMCKGTGQIDAERLAKIEAGEKMRDERRARYVSQSERAAELGMDVVAYSRLENGREP